VSLRTRLVLGMLLLTGLGLLVAGAVTYAEQKSFLMDRIDQQARAALPSVSRELDKRGVNVPGYESRHSGYDRSGTAGGPGDRPGPGGPKDHGGPGPDPASVSLPPGTYGQRRDADGQVLGNVVVTYGEDFPPVPRIPRDLQPGDVVTVGSTGDLEYRAVAQFTDGQPGTTIAAVPMSEVNRTLDRLLRVEALVIGGVLIALALLGWLVVRLGLRPLDRMADTAGAIAAGDLSRRVTPATPDTEVGQLGIALNEMLDRLEEAFRERQASEHRLRQFLADASHELRTPLASIRGYAELFRIGAAQDPGNVGKAMGRIESESARMGVLVEDLLTLARLDETRDVVRERVDLAELARDAADDARAMDPTRSVTVHAEDGVVKGDPHQLRQVVANLLRNAVVHTPAGTPIEVSVHPRGEQVVLEVRDHGLGLPTTDPEVLFERFWRAEKGRARGRAGAGLGLAIVAGLVAAHGGTVTAENAADGGARFVVVLPA
jgi:two-component system OmpR family sensor kinase